MTSKVAINEAIAHLNKVIEISEANRDALPGEAVRLVKQARAKLRKKLREGIEKSSRRKE